jgi:hypothetical protein
MPQLPSIFQGSTEEGFCTTAVLQQSRHRSYRPRSAAACANSTAGFYDSPTAAGTSRSASCDDLFRRAGMCKMHGWDRMADVRSGRIEYLGEPIAFVGGCTTRLVPPKLTSKPVSPKPVRIRVPLGEPNLFCAPRPARSLTPLSARNSATGRVFAASSSLLCPPCPACRADLRLRTVYRRCSSSR